MYIYFGCPETSYKKPTTRELWNFTQECCVKKNWSLDANKNDEKWGTSELFRVITTVHVECVI
mgnify:CR=1 FL=1